MACLHKFHGELYLEGIDYNPDTLIVGTFNPTWPKDNHAEWFYGRTHDEHGNQNNNFWEVLPRIYSEDNLINNTQTEWKQFCRKHHIAITDLIYSIDDAIEGNTDHETILSTFSDKEIASKFKSYTYVDIEKILKEHPSIKNVYLTRGTGETFWRKLWRPIKQYTNHHDLHEARLLTPSGYAFYQQGRYNKRNPDRPIFNLADFILIAWQQEWHQM